MKAEAKKAMLTLLKEAYEIARREAPSFSNLSGAIIQAASIVDYANATLIRGGLQLNFSSIVDSTDAESLVAPRTVATPTPAANNGMMKALNAMKQAAAKKGLGGQAAVVVPPVSNNPQTPPVQLDPNAEMGQEDRALSLQIEGLDQIPDGGLIIEPSPEAELDLVPNEEPVNFEATLDDEPQLNASTEIFASNYPDVTAKGLEAFQGQYSESVLLQAFSREQLEEIATELDIKFTGRHGDKTIVAMILKSQVAK